MDSDVALEMHNNSGRNWIFLLLKMGRMTMSKTAKRIWTSFHMEALNKRSSMMKQEYINLIKKHWGIAKFQNGLQNVANRLNIRFIT